MDGLDWSKYQHQELGESNSLMTMQPISNSILYNGSGKPAEMISIFNSVQQIQKITDFPTNLFPQWHERSRNGAINAAGILSPSSFEQTFPMINNNTIPQRNAACFDQQMSKPSISLESLDCLLSASNTSQTEATSVEDDGISLIFSDCSKTSLWNFTTTPKSSIPITSLSQDRTKPVKNINPHPHHDQKVSQTTSADDHQHATIINHHQHHQEPNPTKRKRPETQSAQPKPSGSTKQQNIDTFPHRQLQSNFHPISDKDQPRSKRHTLIPLPSSNNCISFQQPSSSGSSSADEPDAEAIAQMKEIIYRAAAFRPVDFSPEATEKPRRKNVRISSDPQTVAARQRRERISERIRVLQRLVPGGSKMDTASMLDEAANYLKFLRSQVKALESMGMSDHQFQAVIDCFPVNDGANLAFSLPVFGYPSFAAVHHHQQPQFSIQNHQSKS